MVYIVKSHIHTQYRDEAQPKQCSSFVVYLVFILEWKTQGDEPMKPIFTPN